MGKTNKTLTVGREQKMNEPLSSIRGFSSLYHCHTKNKHRSFKAFEQMTDAVISLSRTVSINDKSPVNLLVICNMQQKKDHNMALLFYKPTGSPRVRR